MSDAPKVLEDLMREHDLGLWVITATVGEYSDQCWWMVAVCLTEEAAKERVDACNEWFRAYIERYEAWEAGDWSEPCERTTCPHDPRAYCWSIAPHYTIERVASLEGVPAVLMPEGRDV